MANNYDSSDGVWRTIGGRKVFIRNGQSLSEAMIASGKFKNLRKDYKTAKKEDEIAKFRENMDIDKEIEKLKEELDKMDGRKVFKAQTEKLAELSEMSGISEDKLLDKLADLRGKSLEQYDDLKDEEENTIKYEGLEKYTKLPEDKYSADEQDILDRYGEDYGYDKDKSNIENLKSQIDYMRNPNESINQTAQRLVEGGDFLIYNEDIKNWLDERGIKYNEDNFFEVYKKEMANKIEKLYNEDNVKQVMTNKDLQKQVAMDVAKSFGAKSVKVNGEEIDLSNSNDISPMSEYSDTVGDGLSDAQRKVINNAKTNNKEAYDNIMKYNKDYDSMKSKIENETKAYDTAYKKLSAERDKYDYGTPERQEITNKLNKLSNEHYDATKDDIDKVNEIRSIRALVEAGETVLLDKNGKTLFNPEYYRKGDNKHINLGINAKTPTVVKDVEILNSVAGQLSDGIWENSPGQERYWTNMRFEQHGDEIVFVTPKSSGYNPVAHHWISNPFSSKTDQETKDYLANKIKQITKIEMEDNPSIGKWDRNNQNTLQYLGHYDDVTVAEAYNLYERLKGRTPKQSKSVSDTLRNSAYQKYMKEHPGSKMTLDEFLKK